MSISEMRARGYFLLVTGFLACPCHLPLTLPLLIAWTAGTALGVFLANNGMLIAGISTAYFVSALALGWRYLTRGEKACEVSSQRTSDLAVAENTKHRG